MNTSELKRLVLNKFQSFSRKFLKEQSDSKKKKEVLHSLEEELESFKEFLERDTTQLLDTIPRFRNLIEISLRIFLYYFSLTSHEKSFAENEAQLARLASSLDPTIEPIILFSLVNSIRLSGRNRVSSTHKEFVDNEVHMVVFSSIYALELFYLGILLDVTNGHPINGSVKSEVVIPTLNVVDAWTRPPRQIDIQKEFNMPLEDTVLETLQQLPVFNISPGISPVTMTKPMSQKEHIMIPVKKDFTELKMENGNKNGQSGKPKVKSPRGTTGKSVKVETKVESVKSSPIIVKTIEKEKFDEGDVKLIPFSECKFLPCVRKACGVSCGLNHEHSDSKKVFLSYGKIGSENCLHGPNCNKYKKLIPLKDGRFCNECPFLHDTRDQDDCKKRIGLGWKLYASGVITYDQIFTAEKLHMQ
jgi:hypothetical protein